MSELAVIGLGRFGRAVARGLAAEGQGVLVVDRDPARLALVDHEVDAALLADTTDRDRLAMLGLDRLSAVVVAIGPRGMEASLLTVALLDELGVERIVARAFDARHARALFSVGAHEVVNPEDDTGAMLARRLALPGLEHRLDLGDRTVAWLVTPESLAGRTVASIEAGDGVDCVVLAVQHAGAMQARPALDQVVASGDWLLVLGPAPSVQRLSTLA